MHLPDGKPLPSITPHEVSITPHEVWTEGNTEVFQRNYDWLARVTAHSYARHAPAVLRDDLLQECRIGLFHAIRRFDPSRGVEFTSFARVVVRRAAIRFLRAERCGGFGRSGEASVHSLHEVFEADVAPGDLLIDPATARELWVLEFREHLRRELSPAQQKVLELHLNYGYTFGEVARHLGMSVGGVVSLWQKMLAQLRRRWCASDLGVRVTVSSHSS